MNYVKEFIVSFLPIQKQTDEYNCDSLAIAFAVEILDGKSPMEARFDVGRMRGNLSNCLENKVLISFPKVWFHLSVKGAVIENYSIRQVLLYKSSAGKKIQAVLHLWSKYFKNIYEGDHFIKIGNLLQAA